MGCVLPHEPIIVYTSGHAHLPSLSCLCDAQSPDSTDFLMGVGFACSQPPSWAKILRLSGAVCVLGLSPPLCVLRGLLFHTELTGLSPLTTEWSQVTAIGRFSWAPLGVSLSPCRCPCKRQEGCAHVSRACGLLDGPAVPPSSLCAHSMSSLSPGALGFPTDLPPRV